jgi:hypothetical protein
LIKQEVLSDWQLEVRALMTEVMQERSLRARDTIRDLEQARGFTERFEAAFLDIASTTASTLEGSLKLDVACAAPESDGRMLGIQWNQPHGFGIWVWFDDQSRRPRVKWCMSEGIPDGLDAWQGVPEDVDPEAWVKDRIRQLVRASLTY